MRRLLLAHLLTWGFAQRDNCDDASILACEQNQIRGSAGVSSSCCPGQQPQYSNQSLFPCCPDCEPPALPYCTDLTFSPFCAAGVNPTMNATSGCLTCRNNCSAAQRATCKMSTTPPPCWPGAGEPFYDAACCPSCITLCQNNVTKMAACVALLNATVFPTCPAGVDNRLSFDPISCCPVCRKTPRVDAICVVTDFQGCIAATRECASGEVPLRENGQCCYHCRRVERRNFCLAEDVGQCTTKMPYCGVGQWPLVIDGECCLSCRVIPPVLCGASACPQGQLCLPGSDGLQCRGWSPNVVAVQISVLSPQLYPGHLARLPYLRNDDVGAMLVEIVRRYCDRTEFRTACGAFLDGTIGGLTGFNNNTVSMDPTNISYLIPLIIPNLPDTNITTTLGYYLQVELLPYKTFLSRAWSDQEATAGLTINFQSVYSGATRACAPLTWIVAFVLMILLR